MNRTCSPGNCAGPCEQGRRPCNPSLYRVNGGKSIDTGPACKDAVDDWLEFLQRWIFRAMVYSAVAFTLCTLGGLYIR